MSADPPGPAAVARRRGAFWRLYRSELRLTVLRRRHLAMLVLLALVPVLIGVAVRLSHPGGGEGPAFLDRITGNGLFLVFTAITVSLPLFFPLVVGVVAGDSIAGEAGQGTLRYLLTVPVSRSRLLAVKSLSVLTFTVLAVAVVAVSGLITGAVLFGVRALVLLSGTSVGVGSALVRVLGVVGYVSLGLFALAAGGVFISTLTENAIAAMAATVGLSIVSTVLDAVPQLTAIHPALLTDHWLGFGELLRAPIDGTDLARWCLLHLAYVAVFLSAAWARLSTKDVTS